MIRIVTARRLHELIETELAARAEAAERLAVKLWRDLEEVRESASREAAAAAHEGCVFGHTPSEPNGPLVRVEAYDTTAVMCLGHLLELLPHADAAYERARFDRFNRACVTPLSHRSLVRLLVAGHPSVVLTHAPVDGAPGGARRGTMPRVPPTGPPSSTSLRSPASRPWSCPASPGTSPHCPPGRALTRS